jgi:hypothetical protein
VEKLSKENSALKQEIMVINPEWMEDLENEH